jgi:hypothetical protein
LNADYIGLGIWSRFGADSDRKHIMKQMHKIRSLFFYNKVELIQYNPHLNMYYLEATFISNRLLF